MDLETAQTIKRVARMIDNVNDRSMLNQLNGDIVVILATALRRQGILGATEVDMIDQAFANADELWPEGRAEKARKVLDASKALWIEAGRIAQG